MLSSMFARVKWAFGVRPLLRWTLATVIGAGALAADNACFGARPDAFVEVDLDECMVHICVKNPSQKRMAIESVQWTKRDVGTGPLQHFLTRVDPCATERYVDMLAGHGRDILAVAEFNFGVCTKENAASIISGVFRDVAVKINYKMVNFPYLAMSVDVPLWEKISFYESHQEESEDEGD